ncbi:hypothetical protein E05_38500 [Plautia stali symbiont]|nr:hypothetical protein E05_38500 [Plautia stali symbiont]
MQVQAAGSSTAPTALAAGAAQLGAMSRPMQVDECQLFIARYGYAPLAVPVAMDALVVVVNQDNPLPYISQPQLDALFSVTRLCGAQQVPQRWGDVGLHTANWATRSIQRFGRNSASGTWGLLQAAGAVSRRFPRRRRGVSRLGSGGAGGGCQHGEQHRLFQF